jgi:hypothetical protein
MTLPLAHRFDLNRRALELGTVALMALSFALLPSDGHAEPIVFTFSGIGTGQLNGTAFSDRAFTFELQGDTNDIRHDVLFPQTLWLDPTFGSIDVGGVGTDTLDLAHGVQLFDSQHFAVAGLFGSGSDAIEIFDPVFATYNLAYAFGPISYGPGTRGSPRGSFASLPVSLRLPEASLWSSITSQ